MIFDRLAQHPAEAEKLAYLHRRTVAPFLQNEADELLCELTARFSDTQLLVHSGGDMIGANLLLPLRWNGCAENLPVSLDDLLIRAIGCRELGKSANTLVCLAVITAEPYDDNELRADILAALKYWTANQGYTSLLALLRPTRKTEYPLTPMGEYINWRQIDGCAFDPELCLHTDMGASVLGVMQAAVTVEADIPTWEGWVDIPFRQSGEYIVEDSLKPVIIDCENDSGFYEEANIWVAHRPESVLQNRDAGLINRKRAQSRSPRRHLVPA